MSILKELKRRNVFRVAVAYFVVAWLLVQVLSIATTSFAAPPWVMKTVITLLLVALPFILFFSWAYEITPEGIKLEKEISRSVSVSAETAKKLDIITIVALLGVGSLVAWQSINTSLQDSETSIESQALSLLGQLNEVSNNSRNASLSQKSIAVLPFVNMSSDEEQEYLADGLSEEILNVLVKIPELKVAGRTSSFSYKDKDADIRLIGETLGVNYLLEGSVRRSMNKLRIVAQLVRVHDGFHIWSESFDRELVDVFEIQDEISRAVASKLAVSLGLEATESLVKERTVDMEAYENYLRAHQLFLKRGKENLDQALLLLNEVTTRDPEFAPAWAGIAAVYSVYESYQSEIPAKEVYTLWRSTGKSAAERAIMLNPSNVYAYMSYASLLAVENDWAGALQNFELALELAPRNADVLDAYAQVLMDMGYYQKAHQMALESVTHDPLVSLYWNTLARTHYHTGEIQNAKQSYKRSIAIDPKLPFPYANLFLLQLLDNEKDSALALIDSSSQILGLGQEKYNSLFAIIESLEDPTALRSLLGQADALLDRDIAVLLKDADALLTAIGTSWVNDYRMEADIFITEGLEMLYSHPRWKQQVHKDGIFALWKEKGFPEHCRPLGQDDFQCV